MCSYALCNVNKVWFSHDENMATILNTTITLIILFIFNLDIIGISCCRYTIYFLHSDSSVTEVCLLTTKECLFALRKMKEWKKLFEVS